MLDELGTLDISVPRTFHQLAILVLDGSGSMGGKGGKLNLTKAEEVNMGVVELINRMQASRVKENFSIACIKFDNSPSVSLFPSELDSVNQHEENFDPMDGKGGGTQIHAALEEAFQMADGFINSAPVGGVKHSAVILLMSDGMCFHPEKTKAVADKIKANQDITLASCYFSQIGGALAEDANDTKNLMMEIASHPVKHYTTVFDGETLRKFFERSISQSSGVKVG